MWPFPIKAEKKEIKKYKIAPIEESLKLANFILEYVNADKTHIDNFIEYERNVHNRELNLHDWTAPLKVINIVGFTGGARYTLELIVGSGYKLDEVMANKDPYFPRIIEDDK